VNNLVIRPLRDENEARACAAFIAASEPWRTLKFSEERLLKGFLDPAREVFVAETGGQVIGLLSLVLAGAFTGYIQNIAVHPDWRGRGLGTQLMQFAEATIFRKSPNVFLCVTDFNDAAQKFYARLGYQKVGELENYLQTGVTEILMRKTRGPLLAFTPEK
jgi:[ribosomal protein S18]-alanine N-acetyltransferase